MKTPKMPPNAKDYGYDTIGGAKCFRVGDKGYSKEGGMPDLVLRQFAACMEVGWRKEAMRIRQNEKPRIKHEVDCDAYAFYSCKTWPKANQAEKQAAKWAEWSEKHAPVTKTV